MAISSETPATEPAAPAEFAIATDKVRQIIVKAREFDAKDVETEPDPGSNAIDDDMLAVLEDHGDDPVEAELRAFIDALNDDEQVELVALTWLGRDSAGVEEWPSYVAQARRAHNRHTATYLLGLPLLSDYLDEGLATVGRSLLD